MHRTPELDRFPEATRLRGQIETRLAMPKDSSLRKWWKGHFGASYMLGIGQPKVQEWMGSFLEVTPELGEVQEWSMDKLKIHINGGRVAGIILAGRAPGILHDIFAAHIQLPDRGYPHMSCVLIDQVEADLDTRGVYSNHPGHKLLEKTADLIGSI